MIDLEKQVGIGTTLTVRDAYKEVVTERKYKVIQIFKHMVLGVDMYGFKRGFSVGDLVQMGKIKQQLRIIDPSEYDWRCDYL